MKRKHESHKSMSKACSPKHIRAHLVRYEIISMGQLIQHQGYYCSWHSDSNRSFESFLLWTQSRAGSHSPVCAVTKFGCDHVRNLNAITRAYNCAMDPLRGSKRPTQIHGQSLA